MDLLTLEYALILGEFKDKHCSMFQAIIITAKVTAANSKSLSGENSDLLRLFQQNEALKTQPLCLEGTECRGEREKV